MAAYIIRLDDACPTMDHEKWDRLERLLIKYGVKPIVGVIPDNQDPDFAWEEDKAFWEKMRRWQSEGYTIAMHGFHHKYLPQAKRKYFQRSHGVNTEFAGVPLERQRAMIQEGLRLMHEHGLAPRCFFAPAHTYDENTVKALVESGEIEYISDGYALRPYKKDGMVFLPSICDGPFHLPGGVFTFVIHPNMLTEDGFARTGDFLKKYSSMVTTPEQVLAHPRASQGLIGWALELGIYLLRGARDLLK